MYLLETVAASSDLAETYYGGPGDDTLEGGGEVTLIYWSSGDGNDLINDQGYEWDIDTLVLHGVGEADVKLITGSPDP